MAKKLFFFLNFIFFFLTFLLFNLNFFNLSNSKIKIKIDSENVGASDQLHDLEKLNG